MGYLTRLPEVDSRFRYVAGKGERVSAGLSGVTRRIRLNCAPLFLLLHLQNAHRKRNDVVDQLLIRLNNRIVILRWAVAFVLDY